MAYEPDHVTLISDPLGTCLAPFFTRMKNSPDLKLNLSARENRSKVAKNRRVKLRSCRLAEYNWNPVLGNRANVNYGRRLKPGGPVAAKPGNLARGE